MTGKVTLKWTRDALPDSIITQLCISEFKLVKLYNSLIALLRLIWIISHQKKATNIKDKLQKSISSPKTIKVAEIIRINSTTKSAYKLC